MAVTLSSWDTSRLVEFKTKVIPQLTHPKATHFFNFQEMNILCGFDRDRRFYTLDLTHTQDLSAGSFGKVKKASKVVIDEEITIKDVAIKQPLDPKDPLCVSSIMKEGENLNRTRSVKGVLKGELVNYLAGKDCSCLLILDLYQGDGLALSKEYTWDSYQIRGMVSEVLQAVFLLAKRGCFHVDLTPQNLLFINRDENLEMVIGDLGGIVYLPPFEELDEEFLESVKTLYPKNTNFPSAIKSAINKKYDQLKVADKILMTLFGATISDFMPALSLQFSPRVILENLRPRLLELKYFDPSASRVTKEDYELFRTQFLAIMVHQAALSLYQIFPSLKTEQSWYSKFSTLIALAQKPLTLEVFEKALI